MKELFDVIREIEAMILNYIKQKLFLIFAVTILGLLAFSIFCLEVYVPRVSIDSYLNSMQPRLSVYSPEEGADIKSAVVLFHGCGGSFNHQEQWAEYFNSHGLHSIVVNSYENRDLQASRVCRGDSFRAYRRASDVIAAISLIKSMDLEIDALFLVGWSHGAWAVMEAISRLSDNKQAGGVMSLPDNVSTADVSGAVLFYPFCKDGFNYRPSSGWSIQSPPLFVFAEEDKRVDNEACKGFIEQNILSYDEYIAKGVGHSFDYPDGLEKLGIYSNPKAREAIKPVILRYILGQETAEN